MKITIRQETKADYDAVFDLNLLAFKKPDESELIKRIRNGNHFVPELSIVAELNGLVLGHILFSKIEISGIKDTYPCLSLGPMAVLPPYQNKGIGSQLVKYGLNKARELGFLAVIVLGHPMFYPRFGFKKASGWNIKCPFDAPDEAFMALELKEGSLDQKAGVVVYPEEFTTH